VRFFTSRREERKIIFSSHGDALPPSIPVTSSAANAAAKIFHAAFAALDAPRWKSGEAPPLDNKKSSLLPFLM
jgi:hypothetical protein